MKYLMKFLKSLKSLDGRDWSLIGFIIMVFIVIIVIIVIPTITCLSSPKVDRPYEIGDTINVKCLGEAVVTDTRDFNRSYRLEVRQGCNSTWIGPLELEEDSDVEVDQIH